MLLTLVQEDKLQEEFMDYQFLDNFDIPETISKEATMLEEDTEDNGKTHCHGVKVSPPKWFRWAKNNRKWLP